MILNISLWAHICNGRNCSVIPAPTSWIYNIWTQPAPAMHRSNGFCSTLQKCCKWDQMQAVKMFQTRMYLSVCSRLLHFFIKSPIFARCNIVKLTQKNCNCSSLLDILLLLCLLKSCINYFPLAFTAFTLTDLMRSQERNYFLVCS